MKQNSTHSQAERILLNPLEALMCKLYETFDGDSVGVVVIRVRGAIEEAPMRTALAALQQRHPRLRARLIACRGGKRCSQLVDRPEPIPLVLKVCDTDEIPWQEEVRRLLGEKLDPVAGLVSRALVLRSRSGGVSDLAFMAHHAVTDGTCFIRIVDDLLTYHELALRDGTVGQVVARPFFSVVQTARVPGLLPRLQLVRHIARQWAAKRRGQWTALPAADATSTHPFWERLVFSREETTRLIERCRDERTTVHAALLAAGLLSLRAILPQETLSLRCRTPINIRSALTGPHGRISDEDLGCFISGYEKIYTLEHPLPFWELARRGSGDLKRFMDAGGPALFYNLVRFARERAFRRMPRRETLAVNNLGPARLRDRYGSLEPEACSLLARNNRLGPSLALMAVGVGGRLSLTLGAVDVPIVFREEFRDNVCEQLRSVQRT